MPVWPICFWSCWPMPALAAMRLPAARTPICCMVTPPSDSAPMAASAARSIVSWSLCFPNLVMWIPRIQTSSAMGALPSLRRWSCGRSPWFRRTDRRGSSAASTTLCCSELAPVGARSGDGLEAVADGLGARFVGADGDGGEPDLHPELDVLGIGRDVHEVAAHARAVAVDDGGHEGHRHPGGGEGDDGEGAHLTGGGDIDVLEGGAAARRAGVATVEEPGTALGALVGDEVGVVAEHQ